MKKRKVYYKVVNPGTGSEGDFMSIFTADPCLHYRVGKYTSTVEELADIGFHPTIFKDRASAKEFIRTMLCGIIFECHVIGLIRKPPLRFTCGASPLHFVQKFRMTTGVTVSAVSHYQGAEWPPGTLMAKKVKLLRRV